MKAYDWVVSYGDEKFIKPETGWAGVDVDKVYVLIVYNKNDPTESYVVDCSPSGIRPIFYETVQMVVKQRFVDNQLIQEPQEPTRITVFGWQKTVNGKNVKSLIRIFNSDGSVYVSDHDPLQ